MCQDEWLNESVIPSANENVTACVTKRLRGACTGSFRNIYHRTIMTAGRNQRNMIGDFNDVGIPHSRNGHDRLRRHY